MIDFPRLLKLAEAYSDSKFYLSDIKRIKGSLRVSGLDQRWPCFPTKSPGNLSPSVLAFLLYVEIS